MEKSATNPNQRKRSTKTVLSAITNFDQQKRTAKKPGTAILAAREQALNSSSVATAAASGDGSTAFSPAERLEMISIAAYRRAEHRDFSGGSPEEDWLEAEAEIDRELGGQRA
ncbi:MAG: DUF2934 domain-containing protein [Georgfuchsia sp.]